MTVATMDLEKARFNMIEQQIRPWNVLDPAVLDLLTVVRREDFVPAEHRDLAYADVEIPLKRQAAPNQRMLAPRIEAKILQALGLRNTDKVLLVGAGSGFLAALMAAKAEFVYAVEIDPELVAFARGNLQRAGVANVSVDLGDGASGWPLYTPYDVIVVSGSMAAIPPAMLAQLRIGGRALAVVGRAPAMELQMVTRTAEDAFATTGVLETVLAPLDHAPAASDFSF